MNRTLCSLAAASFACTLITGCRVNEHNDGKNDKVDISTPFGGMHVNTNNSADTSAIGLTAYPGAVPVKDDNDKDGNSADVNLSFGSFHLGVKAASFQTPDSQDKVLAFYRKDLASRYGDVIVCQNDKPVGTPTRTTQGLTCDDNGHTKFKAHGDLNGIHVDSGSGSELELRTGSEQHQHIVGVEARNGGTRIGLVALDLPSHLSDHDSKDSE
jgi:hypothetical protein